MATKTKARSPRAKAALRSSETPATECRPGVMCTHAGDIGHCWMCWLFKSLIVLFSAFLVLWVGFYLGMIATRPGHIQMDPALERLMTQKRFCSPDGPMSTGVNNGVLERMMGNMSDSIKGKTGADFDKEFLLQMSIHHQGAVDMANQALEKSERPEVKTFAQSIVDTQTAEIAKMKTWLTEWSKK